MASNNDNVVISMSQRNSDDHSGTTSGDLTTFPTEGPVLSFHNICYIKMKSSFLFGQKTLEKKALWNISGIMKPGLNAIMGRLGGDQSLLLDVLAARKDPHGLSGDVWLHGVPHADHLQCISRYVEQDDVMMDTLTVRESLQFSAALQLPATIGIQEKNERIKRIIKDLGLDEVADSKVLSKEDRKRTRIGMELIPDPSILFLDEPTTGLDWKIANDVFKFLKRISLQGRIIIFSIHQPLHSIFELFDSLTLLASGKLLYHGPAQGAMVHFKSTGYYHESYNNLAEFCLHVLHGVIKRELEDYEASKTEVPSNREESMIESLAELYADSALYNNTKHELDILLVDQKKRRLDRKEFLYVTSFGHQLISITRRSLQNLLGHPQPWIVQILVTFIAGLVFGATFRLLKNDCSEIQNRAAVLFLLMAHQWFNSVSAMELFVVHKKLFIHEYISGYYRVPSYFFGTLLSDLLSRRFLPSFIFTCILYLMVEPNPSVDTFSIMIVTLTVVALSSFSLAMVIEATRVLDIYFTCMVIIWGLSFYFGTMIPQLSWLQYFSIPNYGFTALQHNEFLGQNFCSELSTTKYTNCTNYIMCVGEELLIMQNIDLSAWGLWKNHVALVILMIIFVMIAYLKFLFLQTPFLNSALLYNKLLSH